MNHAAKIALAEDVLHLLDQGEDPRSVHERFGMTADGLKKALLGAAPDVANRLPWTDRDAAPPGSRALLKSSAGVILDRANATGDPQIMEAARAVADALKALVEAIAWHRAHANELSKAQSTVAALSRQRDLVIGGLPGVRSGRR